MTIVFQILGLGMSLLIPLFLLGVYQDIKRQHLKREKSLDRQPIISYTRIVQKIKRGKHGRETQKAER